jgi:SAM-dependent methyltransferase
MYQNKFSEIEVRQFWDEVSDIYDAANDDIGDAHYQRFKFAINHIPKEGSLNLLNIWSRTGNANAFLLKHNPQINVFNAEVSYKLIKIGLEKNKYKSKQITQVRLDILPFKSDSFDVVLSLETLEHCSQPLLFLQEIRRVLKKEGLLIMSLPPATAELALRMYDLLCFNHGEGPHKFLASKKVKKLLKHAGFDLLKHKGTLLIPVGPDKLRILGEKFIEKIDQFMQLQRIFAEKLRN